jgi:hypothetical protein
MSWLAIASEWTPDYTSPERQARRATTMLERHTPRVAITACPPPRSAAAPA